MPFELVKQQINSELKQKRSVAHKGVKTHFLRLIKRESK